MIVNEIEILTIEDLEVFLLNSEYSEPEKQTLRDLFNQVPAVQSALDLEFEKYGIRKKDGENMFLRLMAEIRLARLSNNLPLSWSDNILHAFEKVKQNVIEGQWKTAQVECDKIVVDGVIVTQAFLNRIKNTIDSYVLLNY